MAALAGIGENAGVVDIGDGWAVRLKGRIAQPPSLRRALPGAGHRVGGIVRDIMARLPGGGGDDQLVLRRDPTPRTRRVG